VCQANIGDAILRFRHPNNSAAALRRSHKTDIHQIMLALSHIPIRRAEQTDIVRRDAYSVVPCTMGMGEIEMSSWSLGGFGELGLVEKAVLQQRDLLAPQWKYGAGIVTGRSAP
jgi:hypothetical protein